MKTVSSLKSRITRHKDNIVVRRGKRVFVLNKKNKKFNVKQ
jgi:ribosomal protein L36